jgi:hypothetical protein
MIIVSYDGAQTGRSYYHIEAQFITLKGKFKKTRKDYEDISIILNLQEGLESIKETLLKASKHLS